MTRKLILMLAASFAAGVLFVNIYTSLVDVRNWGSQVPASLHAARAYFSVANPGDFFRIFSPANQVITLLALIVCWKSHRSVRIYCLLALAFAVAGDALTFGYFYPRNAILFNGAGNQEPGALSATIGEWRTMNWFRSALVAVNLLLDFAALTRLQELVSVEPKTSDHVVHVPAHH